MELISGWCELPKSRQVFFLLLEIVLRLNLLILSSVKVYVFFLSHLFWSVLTFKITIMVGIWNINFLNIALNLVLLHLQFWNERLIFLLKRLKRVWALFDIPFSPSAILNFGILTNSEVGCLLKVNKSIKPLFIQKGGGLSLLFFRQIIWKLRLLRHWDTLVLHVILHVQVYSFIIFGLLLGFLALGLLADEMTLDQVGGRVVTHFKIIKSFQWIQI